MPFPSDLPHDWWIGMGAAIRGRVQFWDEYLVLYRIHDRNAYHVAGSRCQRMRDEHRLRLCMLQNVLARKSLPLRVEDREFAEQYLHLLRTSTAGAFSWRLCRFYLQHAAVFFGGPDFLVSWQTRPRKSVAAALAATMQPSVFHECADIVKSRRAAVKQMTGSDSQFEPPLNPALKLATDAESPAESVAKLLAFARRHRTYACEPV